MALWTIGKGDALPGSFFETAVNTYDGDPYWPVEDEHVVRWMFSDQHAYGAAIDWAVCGYGSSARAGVFFDKNLTMDGGPAAVFGYWEGMDDLEAHRAVLSFAEEWARERGARRLYGPINFSTYYAYRIRTEGFLDEPPFPGECYNPKYYQGILESLGFQMRESYLSLRPNDYAFPAFEKIGSSTEAKLNAAGLRALVMTPEYWLENRPKIFPVFQATWEDNLGYVPIPYETFYSVYDEKVTKKIDPHLSIVVHDENDEMAGFFVAFPDYGPLLAQGNADRIRESDLNYKDHFPLLERPRLLMKSGCVIPKYRKLGLFTMMSIITCSKAAQYGYRSPVACMVRSDNPSQKMGDFLQKIEPRTEMLTQNYGLFVKDL